jgi:hypothetical protein
MPISLAIGLSGDSYDMEHDLTLTGAERIKAFPEHGQRPFALLTTTIACEALLDSIEKILITETEASRVVERCPREVPCFRPIELPQATRMLGRVLQPIHTTQFAPP